MAIKKVSVVRRVTVGAGMAAGVAGALAGAYLLFLRTKPQQKKAKEWVLKAQKAAGVEAKKFSSIGEKEYQRIVEKAMRHYGEMHKIGGVEMAAAIKDAKAEWKHIQAEAKKVSKVKPAVKKVAKKPAKKAVKKTVRK